ncbi:MAG: glycine cleavage system protein GcvH [Candidatus Omnitrophica bacterium]|nr:glycine cleavage system protein GcvH [Candidatus Omnitrophota bacterium]
MNVPDGLLYTKEHEWVKIEGNQAKMGITEYAQSSLGDITFVELPNKQAECAQFKQIATVESVKAASDIYAPMSGKVIQINDEVQSKPELLNQSSYDLGWFLSIEISDVKETENLMSAQEYKKFLEGIAH